MTILNDSRATASAQHLNIEVRYPVWLVPEGQHELKQPPVINAWSYDKHDVTLHPGLTCFMRATFRIPSGRTVVPMHVVVSGQDTRAIYKMLRLNVSWI